MLKSPNPVSFVKKPPTYDIPEHCNIPIAKKNIEIIKNKGVEYLKADSTVPDHEKNWLKWQDGLTYRMLSLDPVSVGIMIIDEHMELDPHYHDFFECYYIISGKARTWIDGEYVDMTAGHHYEIPANGIHHTFNYGPEPCMVMFYFPYQANYHDKVVDYYYYIHNSTDEEALPQLEKIHANPEYMKLVETRKIFLAKNEKLKQGRVAPRRSERVRDAKESRKNCMEKNEKFKQGRGAPRGRERGRETANGKGRGAANGKGRGAVNGKGRGAANGKGRGATNGKGRGAAMEEVAEVPLEEEFKTYK